MIKIIKCSEVSEKEIYETFTNCFADYMIQMKIEQDVFINRFFGAEGNDRDLSYIAYQDGIAVGIVLGGLKTDENFKTLRCGGMAVMPEVRGKGVADKLIEMHIKTAESLGCRQVFLEVVASNDRAINFYKKFGYAKVYDLNYRTLSIADDSIFNKIDTGRVENSTYEEVIELRNYDHTHLPWQRSFEYIKDLPCKYYVIKEDNKVVAAIVGAKQKVYYLWVNKNYRNRGHAKALIAKIVQHYDAEELLFTFANSNSMHTFADNLNMKREEIAQIEMYKWLG